MSSSIRSSLVAFGARARAVLVESVPAAGTPSKTATPLSGRARHHFELAVRARPGFAGTVGAAYSPSWVLPVATLYLVYNERLNTGRGGTHPIVPLSGGRTLLVKYTYTFTR